MNKLVNLSRDIMDAARYPTMTKKERNGFAMAFFLTIGPLYLAVLAFDKTERADVRKAAHFHRQMNNKHDAPMTESEYWDARRKYFRENNDLPLWRSKQNVI
jgi:hypothetical protein